MFHLEALGRAEFMRELGAVFLTCKYWNAVVSSIPELWCDIEIALDDSRIKPPFLSIAAIKSWLSRSKGLPLNLVISFQHLGRRVDSSDGRKYTEVAFELFLAQLARWRSVSLNFGERFNATLLTSLHAGAIAPLLETIDVTFNSWSGARKHWYLSLYAAAPSLRNYINRGPYGTDFLPHPFPWGQLSHFHLESALDPRTILGMLEKGSNLQACHFVLQHPSRIPMISISQNGPSQLVGSPIRCMSLRFSFTPQECPLLTPDLLLTPNLKYFEVHLPSRSPDPQPQYDLLYPYLEGFARLCSPSRHTT